MDKEISNWPKILYEELPAIVRPLFSLGVFFIIFLIIGNSLGLNNSLWLITKEGLFNLVFLLGSFSLIFTALNQAKFNFQKVVFSRKYPNKKLNKDYFLGQYEGFNKVFVFEIKNQKKIWIENRSTRRGLWPDVDPVTISGDKMKIGRKTIDLREYKKGQEYDEKIDILNPGPMDNLILLVITTLIFFVAMGLLRLLPHS